MTDYALHGVREYWLVDTEAHTVEQYLLNGTTYQLAQKLKDGTLTSEIVAGFRIAIPDIFSE